MVSKKVIIGAVIAVAVVAIAVIALSGEEEPNARLNCKVELADSFTSMGLMGPYQQMPDEGMKYAILTYKGLIRNKLSISEELSCNSNPLSMSL